MSWTSKIKQIIKEDGGGVAVAVEFSDGKRTVNKNITTKNKITLDWLKQEIKNIVDALSSQDDITTKITLDQEIDLSGVDPAPKSQEQIDADNWINRYYKWQKIKSLVTNGILTGNEVSVVNFLNQLKADFKVEYLNLI